MEKDAVVRELVARRDRLDVDQTSLETFLKDSARRLAAATTTASLLRVVREVNAEATFLLSVHQTRLDQSDVDDKKHTPCTGMLATLRLCNSV